MWEEHVRACLRTDRVSFATRLALSAVITPDHTFLCPLSPLSVLAALVVRYCQPDRFRQKDRSGVAERCFSEYTTVQLLEEFNTHYNANRTVHYAQANDTLLLLPSFPQSNNIHPCNANNRTMLNCCMRLPSLSARMGSEYECDCHGVRGLAVALL